MPTLPSRSSLAGIFLLSLSLLMLEITLTRVFSVTMWYHFAFLSISLALLGGAVGGIWAYLASHRLGRGSLYAWRARIALLFAVATVATFVLYTNLRFWGGAGTWQVFTPQGMGMLILVYLDLALPFFLGGLCLAVAMSEWAESVSVVYFADLIGASIGCIVSVITLSQLGGPNTMIVIGIVGGLAALMFALSSAQPRWQVVSVGVTVGCAALLVANLNWNFIRVISTKTSGEGAPEAHPLVERWNSFSRVTVYPEEWGTFGWGMSRVYQGPLSRFFLMLIDTAAGTPIQKFDGNLASVDFLRYDVTSLAHYVRPNARVLIIGPGGGRDVLAALVFKQPEIVGVEINPIIVDLVRGRFGDYAGRVYDQPGVSVVVDEARNYISRSPRKYDVIQASLIDTWAATSAGAFALSENSLYTEEAFRSYYDHLSDDGLLTVTRWYLPDSPGETLRLVSLGLAAWRRSGAADPRESVIVVANLPSRERSEGAATMLLKKTPFTAQEVASVERVATAMQFSMVYAPGLPSSNEVSALVNAPDWAAFWKNYPVDISPTTDDRPFFFNLFRVGDALDPKVVGASGVYRRGVEALQILGRLLAVTAGISALFILGPLLLFERRALKAKGRSSFLLYFASLGAGFMLIEIPVVQRFILFLGHPIYALAVVLFSLLFFGGLGSFSTRRVTADRAAARLTWSIPALVALSLLNAFAAPPLLNALLPLPLEGRMAVAVMLLAPLGLLMGMPFPMGIKIVSEQAREIVPWVWGVNGATSVLGSVLAVMLSINFGFRAALVVGTVIYLGALLLARTVKVERAPLASVAQPVG